eukprot:SAG22_NODE_4758_length_1172_cov_1.780056_4_plen_23_part_01
MDSAFLVCIAYAELVYGASPCRN